MFNNVCRTTIANECKVHRIKTENDTYEIFFFKKIGCFQLPVSKLIAKGIPDISTNYNNQDRLSERD